MNERDSTGRFTPGNGAGRVHRFAPGQTGNPAGRPPKLATCLRALLAAAPSDAALRELIDNPGRRDNERRAARYLLTDRHVHQPIAEADPVEAKRLYRAWFRKSIGDCVRIFVDPSQSPERREAARQRVFAGWYAGWGKADQKSFRSMDRPVPAYRPGWLAALSRDDRHNRRSASCDTGG